MHVFASVVGVIAGALDARRPLGGFLVKLLVLFGFLATGVALIGGSANPADTSPAAAIDAAPAEPLGQPVVVPITNQHILGIIPDYQTVRDPTLVVAPMTQSQKWLLVWKGSVDPFNITSAVLGAGISQADNQMPKYGEGHVAFAKRIGAGYGDFEVQNVAMGFFAVVLHQDPRYFRRGPSFSVIHRTLYAVSRLGVTRLDSGRDGFNSSALLGMAVGIGASNAYYPSSSRNEGVMISRIGTGLASNAMGNIMAEFWPDIQQKLFHRKQGGVPFASLAK